MKFNPRTYSNEQEDTILLKKREAAEILVEEYVPSVVAAIADVKDVYTPSGNRELLEAAAVFYGIVNKCSFGGETFKRDFDNIHDIDAALLLYQQSYRTAPAPKELDALYAQAFLYTKIKKNAEALDDFSPHTCDFNRELGERGCISYIRMV